MESPSCDNLLPVTKLLPVNHPRYRAIPHLQGPWPRRCCCARSCRSSNLRLPSSLIYHFALDRSNRYSPTICSSVAMYISRNDFDSHRFSELTLRYRASRHFFVPDDSIYRQVKSKSISVKCVVATRPILEVYSRDRAAKIRNFASACIDRSCSCITSSVTHQ